MIPEHPGQGFPNFCSPGSGFRKYPFFLRGCERRRHLLTAKKPPGILYQSRLRGSCPSGGPFFGKPRQTLQKLCGKATERHIVHRVKKFFQVFHAGKTACLQEKPPFLLRRPLNPPEKLSCLLRCPVGSFPGGIQAAFPEHKACLRKLRRETVPVLFRHLLRQSPGGNIAPPALSAELRQKHDLLRKGCGKLPECGPVHRSQLPFQGNDGGMPCCLQDHAPLLLRRPLNSPEKLSCFLRRPAVHHGQKPSHLEKLCHCSLQNLRGG